MIEGTAGLVVAFILLTLIVQVAGAAVARHAAEAAVSAAARRAARPGALVAVEEERLAADLATALPGATGVNVEHRDAAQARPGHRPLPLAAPRARLASPDHRGAGIGSPDGAAVSRGSALADTLVAAFVTALFLQGAVAAAHLQAAGETGARGGRGGRRLGGPLRRHRPKPRRWPGPSPRRRRA